MTRIFTAFFILFTALTIATTSTAQAVNTDDSLALVDLYNSTNGANWLHNSNWLSGPVSTWYGITVTGTRVTAVNLNHNQLTGHLETSVGKLTALRYLFLHYNAIEGNIPANIGHLEKLQWLALETNKFTGSIPASIGKLINAVQVTLDGNLLTGAIPRSVNNLSKLQYFSATYNQLTGGVPYLGGMLALISFNVSFNNLYVSSNVHYKDSTINALLNVSNNRFTFDGLEYIAKNFPNAVYSPQYPLTIHQRGDSLYVSAGGRLDKNTYQWNKIFTNEKVVIKGDSAYHPLASNTYYSVLIANKIANKLTLSGDPVIYNSLNTAAVASVSKDEMKQTFFKVYPNPASGVLHIQAAVNTSIIISDASGKLMLAKVINSNTSSINVSGYASGIYYIQNKTSGETKQIIVAH